MDDFAAADPSAMISSSYKNIAYPLGCSKSELNVALGQGDLALESKEFGLVGFARVKAMLEDICYLDLHLLADEGVDDVVGELLNGLEEEYEIGKYYIQILPYEARERGCLERLGFSEEARLQEQIFVGGEYHDLLMMGSVDTRV